jgi:DHA1 family multidrug resistance protein-like MFS transporter
VASLFVVSLLGTEVGAASVTGLLMGSAALTGAISAVYLGRLGDKVGHNRVLLGSAVAAALLYAPQPFVTSAWQLVLLQALAGFAVGGMLPAISALMNLWAPAGNQGATYGLDTSINAAARSVAPMVAAAIAAWIGLRGVFGAGTVVYGLIVVLILHVLRSTEGKQQQSAQALRGAGDD